MDGQEVERRVQPPCGSRRGLLQQPPALGGEPARGVGLAGLAERAHAAVKQPSELVEPLVARSVQRCSSTARRALRSQ